MSPEPAAPALGATIREEFITYIRHLAGRVERAARSVPRDKLWTRPFPFGNSIGHLVLHLTGNLNHYIGAKIAGTGYVRDRPLEFTDPTRLDGEIVLKRFQDAVEMVAATINALDDQALLKPVPAEQPIETCFGLILVVTAHLNNHIGQLSYLVQALGHSTDEPPVW